MKNRKLLVAGLCGALCLSLAGFTYASAQAADAPKTSAEETAQMSSTDIFFNDADGISTDGENWVTEADYEKNNPAPDVEWWTAEEYEKWIATQKEELEALIGTGDGWYDGQGVFHEWTQESVDATIAEYQETLESIKNGTLYSKDNGEGDTYSMIPPTEDVVSEYGVMARCPGRVFSREQLYNAAWGEDYELGTNTVDNTIWRLRNKLEPNPKHPTYIKTVFRVGYKIEIAHG